MDVTPLLTITILLRDREPLSRDTSLFLNCNTFDRYFTNSAFASPSLGGAALNKKQKIHQTNGFSIKNNLLYIWTPTPSVEMSVIPLFLAPGFAKILMHMFPFLSACMGSLFGAGDCVVGAAAFLLLLLDITDDEIWKNLRMYVLIIYIYIYIYYHKL